MDNFEPLATIAGEPKEHPFEFERQLKTLEVQSINADIAPVNRVLHAMHSDKGASGPLSPAGCRIRPITKKKRYRRPNERHCNSF